MRKTIFISIIFLFIIFSIVKTSASNINFPLVGKTIVIDPGHGGLDNGANYEKIKEKDLNINIGIKLKNILE